MSFFVCLGGPAVIIGLRRRCSSTVKPAVSPFNTLTLMSVTDRRVQTWHPLSPHYGGEGDMQDFRPRALGRGSRGLGGADCPPRHCWFTRGEKIPPLIVPFVPTEVRDVDIFCQKRGGAVAITVRHLNGCLPPLFRPMLKPELLPVWRVLLRINSPK